VESAIRNSPGVKPGENVDGRRFGGAFHGQTLASAGLARSIFGRRRADHRRFLRDDEPRMRKTLREVGFAAHCAAERTSRLRPKFDLKARLAESLARVESALNGVRQPPIVTTGSKRRTADPQRRSASPRLRRSERNAASSLRRGPRWPCAVALALEAKTTPLRLQLGADSVAAVRGHTKRLRGDLAK